VNQTYIVSLKFLTLLISVSQGVPLAREYGGLLDNRSFGGTLVSFMKGQTGQQLLGAYSAMNRQIGRGK
jgi:succinate dehydrogenase / fumarate reductase flavoprotein subunit